MSYRANSRDRDRHDDDSDQDRERVKDVRRSMPQGPPSRPRLTSRSSRRPASDDEEPDREHEKPRDTRSRYEDTDRERERERSYRDDDDDPSPVKPNVRMVARSRSNNDRRIASAVAASSTFVPRDLQRPPPHPHSGNRSNSLQDDDIDRDRERERRYAPREDQDYDHEDRLPSRYAASRGVERESSLRGSRDSREKDRDRARERDYFADDRSRDRDRDRDRDGSRGRGRDEDLDEDFEELVLEDDRRPYRERERNDRSSWAKTPSSRRDDDRERHRDRDREREVRGSTGSWTNASASRARDYAATSSRRGDDDDYDESADTVEDMRRRQQNNNNTRRSDNEWEEVRQEDRQKDERLSAFDEYATRREEAGETLIRKSGRYDEDDEHSQGKSHKEQASGSWMTGESSQKNSALVPSSGVFSATSRNSFVLVAHPRGARTNMVQCTIIRDRSSVQGKLYPSYELILEEPRKTLIIAQKMSMNRTSNYHLFDMTRGQAGSKLSKKAGNYLGKLRSKNVNRTGYSLLNSKSDKEEMAGVIFDRVTVLDQLKEGNQPRRMTVIIPPTYSNGEGLTRPVALGSLGVDSLTDVLQEIEEKKRVLPENFSLLHTKDPVFENGNYRLNFHGRVSMPSVKNFQMVSDDDIEDIKCQFGKVDQDVFHLDYRAPFNSVQAFALALCQFNL